MGRKRIESNKKKTPYTCAIPKEYLDILKEEAERKEVTVSSIIVNAIKVHIDNNGNVY